MDDDIMGMEMEMEYQENPMRTSSSADAALHKLSSTLTVDEVHPNLRHANTWADPTAIGVSSVTLSDSPRLGETIPVEMEEPFRSKIFDLRDDTVRTGFNDVKYNDTWCVASASNGKLYYRKLSDPSWEGRDHPPIRVLKKEGANKDKDYFGLKCCCFHPFFPDKVYVGTYEGFGKPGHIQVVDLEKGKVIGRSESDKLFFSDKHTEAIFGLAVSNPSQQEPITSSASSKRLNATYPTPLLISVSWDKTACIYRLNKDGGWEAKNGAHKIVEHNREILSVAISPSARIFCLGGRDVMVYRMPININDNDLSDPLLMAELDGYSEHVNCLCFSRKAPYKLFSGSDDNSVKVWDASSKNDQKQMDLDPKNWTLVKTLVGHRDKVKCISESPCGKYLCSGSGDHEVHHTSNASSDKVNQNAHHHHKRQKEKDKTCRVWDIEAGVELRSLYGHSATVRGVTFVGNNSEMKIVSASEDGTCRLWNIAVSEKKRKVLKGFETKYGVRSFVMSEDGKIIVSQTDETVRVWNHTETQDSEMMTLEKNSRSVASVAVTKDGNTAVTAGENDKTIIFWRLDPNLGKDPPVDEEDRLSSQSSTRDLNIDKRVINHFTISQDISFVAYAPDEKSLFVATTKSDKSGSLLKQISIEDGTEIQSFYDLNNMSDPPNITTLAISAIHNVLIAGSEDGSILVFDIQNGADGNTLTPFLGAHSDRIEEITISRDGSKVVTVSSDSSAMLWDMDTLIDEQTEHTKKALHLFEEHSSCIHSASIHPSGKYLVTASHDKTWRLWHLVEPYSLIYTNNDSHEMSVRSCSFSPDGKFVITGSKDKTISMEEFDSHLHRLPSSVHRSFLADCKLEDRTPGRYDWENSDTKKALALVPHSLLEPRFDNGLGTTTGIERSGGQMNLIHLAASFGRNNFLRTALFAPSDDLEKQKLAFLALMRKDINGDTPLKYAVEAESDPVVKVLLDCYNILFKQEYALPFHKNNTSQELHPTERFPLEEFFEVCQKHPSLALKFVSALSLVTSDDLAVQEGVERHNFKTTYRQIIRGSDTRVPRGFWKEHLDQKKNEETPGASSPTSPEVKVGHGSTGMPVMAKIVPIKGVASKDSKFLQKLVEAASQSNFISAFENEVIEAIINHKWRTYVRKKFDRHMYLYVVLVIAITIDAITFKRYIYTIEETSLVKVLGFLPMVVVIGLWLFFTEHECSQFRNAESSKDYFMDLWNVVDLCSLVSIFLTYLTRILEMQLGRITFFEEGHATEDLFWSTLLLSFAVVATYLNILYFLQGVQKKSGQLVRVILGIFSDMHVFIGIALTCLVGFSVGFYVLFEDKKQFQNENIMLSIFTSYTLMLSEFDFSEEYLTKSTDTIAVCILFFSFTFGINIVMLNLLIAIMGDTFDRIQENSQAEFMFARAQIVLEYEGNLSEEEKNNKEWFPTWLQVLVPTLEERAGDHENWVGRVRELKNAMKNEIGDLTTKLNESERKRKVELEERRRQEKKMEEKMTDTTEKIEELLGLVKAMSGVKKHEKLGRRISVASPKGGTS